MNRNVWAWRLGKQVLVHVTESIKEQLLKSIEGPNVIIKH